MDHTDLPDDVPRYPKVNAAIVPVALSPDEIQFRAGPFTGPVFDIEDDDREGKLEELVSLLDGTNSIEEIIAEFGEENAAEVVGVVLALQENDIVYEGADAAERNDDVRGYFSVRDHYSEASLEYLETASVLVAGYGRTSAYLARDAVEMGISELTYVALGDDETPADLRENEIVETATRDDFADAIETVDIAVLATDRPEPNATSELNELALETETPLLLGQVCGLDGFVGPTVIPGETACYECFRERRDANLDDPSTYRQYERTTETSDGVPGAAVPGFGHVVAGCLSIELYNQLTSGFGFTVGQTIHYDFTDLSVEVDGVLRMPRCPACGKSPDSLDASRHVTLDRIIEERENDATPN